jgi:hypothetical protein
MKLQGQFWLEAGSYDAGASVPIAVRWAVPLVRRQQRYPKAIGLLIGSVGKIAARCDMADEYDPFADADPEEDAAAASGGGDSAPAAEKIVMKLDAGKKKTKVAAVFDVRGRSAAVP